MSFVMYMHTHMYIYIYIHTTSCNIIDVCTTGRMPAARSAGKHLPHSINSATTSINPINVHQTSPTSTKSNQLPASHDFMYSYMFDNFARSTGKKPAAINAKTTTHNDKTRRHKPTK